jgi:hypothetical protein
MCTLYRALKTKIQLWDLMILYQNYLGTKPNAT